MCGLQGGGSHDQPGGQTREHAQLARSLGVEQLAVVVTKLDTVGYSQVRGSLPHLIRSLSLSVPVAGYSHVCGGLPHLIRSASLSVPAGHCTGPAHGFGFQTSAVAIAKRASEARPEGAGEARLDQTGPDML